jgi:hypothetical protein
LEAAGRCSTVALSQDTVYALVAGVILALGIAAIALRMSWFELEIFGILAKPSLRSIRSTSYVMIAAPFHEAHPAPRWVWTTGVILMILAACLGAAIQAKQAPPTTPEPVAHLK